MAIYIQLRKVEESSSDVAYDFGPAEEIVGRVLWSKEGGQLRLLEITSESRAEFYLPRIRRVLERQQAAGEYPDRACYAA